MAEWRDVPGWEGMYQVSDEGEVKSLYLGKERILKPNYHYNGYLRITLCRNKRVQHTGIHRLVALAFVPNPDNKPEVNHINGNKSDNRAGNLEWATSKENQKHAVKTGLYDPYLQARCRPILAFDKSTGEIKRYISASDAARQLNLCKTEIVRQAIKNESYRKETTAQYFFLYDPKGETDGKKTR